MPSFPLNLQLRDRLALVVGGGKVALRKAVALHAAGAQVRVVAPAVDAEFARFLAPDRLAQRAYRDGDLDGAFLVIAATDDAAVNDRVVRDARERGILCSDAADPQNGDFTLPATLRLDDVTIAVDTAGASPAFAKRIANELQAHLDPRYGRAAATLRVMRDYIVGVVPQAQRGDVLREVASLPLEDLASLGPGEAQHRIDAIVELARGIRHEASTNAVVAASRGSQLALTQTRTVAAKLALQGLASTILTISTLGDKVQDRSIAAIGAENIFVKELELALRDGRAQYAVHSCKDLPSTLPPDMQLVAVSAREDARDAFCSERFESFAALPPGSRVGTSSPRRRAQLLALRPDLEYVDIRGNVDTRLRKLREGTYDAIVLAMAGLARLGVRATHTVAFEADELVPAVGQGALGIEMSRGHDELAARVRAALNDPACELAVTAERAALAALRGGCQAPIGVHATARGGGLEIAGVVVSTDGSKIVRARQKAAVASLGQAQALGEQLGRQLLESGAASILEGAPADGLRGKTIVLPRTQDRPSRIAAALEIQGARVLQWRTGEAAPQVLGEALPDMIVFPSSGSVAAAAPLLEVWRKRPQRPGVAAMGPASAAAATAQGYPPDVTADEPDIDALLAALRAYFR